MKRLQTPISIGEIDALEVGDFVTISGCIFAGRDAVLPRICNDLRNGSLQELKNELMGGVIFHTAVSQAGVGPTSSNKVEIEDSIIPLSQVGVRIHLGKGRILPRTISALGEYHSCFAIIPPVTSLLAERTISKEIIAYPELGMEALYKLKVDNYPAIIASVNGRSLFGDETQ